MNPWKDIASYEIEDAKWFKGREEDLKKFIKIINSGTMSVLYANSGIGKTSFLKAGVESILITEGYYPIHITFPDEVFQKDKIGDWLYQRINAFIKNKDVCEWKTRINYDVVELNTSLWWLLHTNQLQNKNGEVLKPLIVFDQFEEVFTKSSKYSNRSILDHLFLMVEELGSSAFPKKIEHVLEQLDEKGTYLDIDSEHHYKIIFSLRKEYLSNFDFWTNDKYSITELYQNRMFLLPLTREQAEKVIIDQPVADNSEEKIKTLLPVKKIIIRLIDSQEKDEIEPFILSVLCSKLYDKAIKDSKEELTENDISGIDINGIIRKFYEEKISNIIINKHHLAVFEELLVDEDGYRNRIKVKSFRAIKLKERYLKKLDESHLVRVEKNVNNKQNPKRNNIHDLNNEEYNDNDFVELIHDRIADAIRERRQEGQIYKARLLKGVFVLALMLVLAGITVWKALYSDNPFASKLTYLKQDKVLNFTPFDSEYGRTNYQNESNLKEVNFVGSFGGHFSGCESLEKVLIKSIHDFDTTKAELKGIVYITSSMFANCKNLRSVSIDTTSIQNQIAEIAIELKDSLGDNRREEFIKSFKLCVYGVDDGAFRNCSNLTKFELRNIGFIGKESFSGCNSLTSFNIDNNTERIDSTAFLSCPHIDFHISKENKNFVYENGFLINLKDTSVLYVKLDTLSQECKSKKRVVAFPQIISNRNEIVYDSITFVNRGLGNVYRKLSSRDTLVVYKNEDVGRFSDRDFRVLDLSRCDNLEIGYKDYQNCRNLEEVIFPQNISSIGASAFEGCINLKSIDLRNLRTQGGLGAAAFKNCNKLQKVVLPSEIDIRSEAFSGCTSLEEINLDSVRSISDLAFYNCKNLSSVNTLLLSRLEDCAFSNSGIERVSLPLSMNDLNLSAFKDCNRLSYIKLPNVVKKLFSPLNFGKEIIFDKEQNSKFREDKHGYLWYGTDTLVACGKVQNHVLNGLFWYCDNIFYYYSQEQLRSESDMLCSMDGNNKKYINGFPHLKILHIPNSISKHVLPPYAVLGKQIDSLMLNNVDFSQSKIYSYDHHYLIPNNIEMNSLDIDMSIICVKPCRIMNVPVEADAKRYEVLFYNDQLEEIHIPFTEPGFDLEISDSEKTHITLYVPYGTKEIYKALDIYGKYKEIKEDNIIRQARNLFVYAMVNMVGFFGHNIHLFIILIVAGISFVVVIIYVYNKKQGKVLTVVNVVKHMFVFFLVFIAIIVSWGIAYYFFWLGLNIENKFWLCALPTIFVVIVSLLSVMWVAEKSIVDIEKSIVARWMQILDMIGSIRSVVKV